MVSVCSKMEGNLHSVSLILYPLSRFPWELLAVGNVYSLFSCRRKEFSPGRMENRGPWWKSKSLWNLACGLGVLPWFLNGNAMWLIKELAGEDGGHGHLIMYQDWNKRRWAIVVNSKAHVSQQNSWNTLGTNGRVWRGTCQWSYLQISLVCCSVKAEQWTLHCISCQRLHRQKREAINDEIYIIWL